MSNYKVKCIDAKYDHKEEMLVLNCWFFALNEKRIVCMPRKDFHYKTPGVQVPTVEMIRTAELFRGKEFNLTISDDPNLSKLDKDKESKIKQEMFSQMNDISSGMADESSQIQRKLGRMAKEGKLDLGKLLKSELDIQKDIGKFT